MKKVTYHWMIVAALFFVQVAGVGIVVNCYNVLSPAMMEEGLSASAVQTINLARTLTSLPVGIVVGMIIRKVGYSRVTVFGSLLIPIGMALRSFAFSVPLLMATSLLMGIGSGCVTNVPVNMALNNWFYDKKATASAIAFTGSSVGGFVFVQVATAIIKDMGWRQANFVLAVITAGILLPVTLFLLREKPEDKGLMPYGAEKAAERSANEPSGAVDQNAGITLSRYARKASFYWMILTAFLFGFVNMGIQNNMNIFLKVELGKSADFTSMIYSIVMIVMIFGKLFGGFLFDKIGMNATNIYNLVIGLLCLGMIMMSGQAAIFAILFGVTFGLRQGLCSLGPPYMTAMIVGRREYSKIYGIIGAIFAGGSATGPVVGAMIFDHTGSFHGTWLMYGALTILMGISCIAAVQSGKGFSNE